MRKLILSLAALAALGVVMPYAAPAKAETVIIHRHGDRFFHPHHDRTVIIKHHDHDRF